jgi:RHS repeat-associated protein
VYTTTSSLEDSIRRPVSVSYQNGNANLYSTPTKTFTYDALSSPWSGVSLGYSKGRLVFATTGNASTQIANYDALGDAQSTVQCLPGWCGQHSYDVVRTYSYDLTGSETQEQYLTQGSAGNAISVNMGRSLSGDLLYLSGGQNNVSTITDPNGQPILLNITQPGPFGIVSGQLGNGLGIAASYDTLGRLQGGWVCNNGVTSPNCSGATTVYSFSSLTWTGGYLTGSSDSALGYSSGYSYDQFGRLAATNIGSGQAVFSYQYDRFGNRWSQTATGSGSGSVPQPSLSFNLVNNLTSNNQVASGSCNPVTASQYCYDAAGNMIADGFHTYTYDAEGNVVGIDGTQGVAGAAQSVYDAFNQRVETVSESGTVQRYAYNLDGQRASTWSSSGSLASANYYADGQAIAYYSNTDGFIHFQHQDWNGTVRVRTKYNGGSDGTFTSYAFGDGYNSTGNDSDPLHFALLDHDPDSDTDRAQARQYSNMQGHWLSPDPYDGSYDYANPQSLNRYVYVLDNPLSSNDSAGLMGGCNGAAPLGSDNNCDDSAQAKDYVNGEFSGNATSPCGDSQNGGVSPDGCQGWLRALLGKLGNLLSGSGGDNSGAPPIGGLFAPMAFGQVPIATQQTKTNGQPQDPYSNHGNTSTVLVSHFNGPHPMYTIGNGDYKTYETDWSPFTLGKEGSLTPIKGAKVGLMELFDGTTKWQFMGEKPERGEDAISTGPGIVSMNQHWYVNHQQVQLWVGMGKDNKPILTWEFRVNRSGGLPVYTPVP